MRAKSALDSTIVQAATAAFVGLFVFNTLRRARPVEPTAPSLPPTPQALPAPDPAPPLPVVQASDLPVLRLEQRVRVECAGIIYEGLIQSIYINDGEARIGLIDQVPEPINPILWTWEDEGESLGS